MRWVMAFAACVIAPTPLFAEDVAPRSAPNGRVVSTGSSTTLVGIGDSLSHGTMDGTNNSVNTLHAYLQLVADSLDQVIPLTFSQPLFDEHQERIAPLRIPTNLGVDGADSFNVEGLAYYKRAGTSQSLPDDSLVCDAILPRRLDSKYDKVMYPINVLARQPVTVMDAARWLLERFAPASGGDRAIVVLWIGNNDSGGAALGGGGENPTYLPIPVEQIEPEVNRDLRLLLRVAQERGIFSSDSYVPPKIERFLTDASDFHAQYEYLLERLTSHPSFTAGKVDIFVLTLPYYSAVGYLFDSEDLEFYLRKLHPSYAVPPTFARVAKPDEPITEALRGDRVAILTFGFMYALLDSGYSVAYVNQVLEQDGVQRDDMVLSQAEQAFIMARIDSFNGSIRSLAAMYPHVYVVDVGGFLNSALAGETQVEIGGKVLSRKWTRGCGFSLDGVHPGYTGQALVANFVLNRMNEVLGLKAPMHEAEQFLETDPYVDHDGDGWAPGPSYAAAGLTELLFLLTDPDDADGGVEASLPRNVWDLISDAMLEEVLGVPSIRRVVDELAIAAPR